ncbi:MAG: hypothetical protein AAF449_13965, partial [Myxococcota bacterium]
KAPGCTLWVQGGPSTPSINVPTAANGAIVSLPPPGAGGPPPSQYRIDFSISGHPDALRFQRATEPRTRVITVWACWRDESQTVNEVRTRRILY